MAQILRIAAGTARDGVSVADDIVGVFEDDHPLDGPAYSTFSILVVPETVAEVNAELESKCPSLAHLTTEEKEDPYKPHKHAFKVTDPDGATLSDKLGTNLELKDELKP